MQMPGGGGYPPGVGSMQTRGVGGQKLVKFCGCLLWMAPYLFIIHILYLLEERETNWFNRQQLFQPLGSYHIIWSE